MAALWTAPAAAQQIYPYCVENKTNMTIQTHHQGANSFVDIGPGRYSCCYERCNGRVTAGISYEDERDLADKTQFILERAVDLLVKMAPPGQPILQGPPILPFCNLDPGHGDTIQVFRTGQETWRCDILPANGTQVAYSLNHKGRVETPWSYINACNRAGDGTGYVAYGWLEDGRWVTEGWRVIDPGQCSKLYLARGYRHYAYVYANTDSLQWRGEWDLCVHPNNEFRILDADREYCARGNEKFQFIEIDVDGEAANFAMGPSQR
jgi:uncharacterized membrane protein